MSKRKGDCIVCGTKTHDFIWVGGSSLKTGKQTESAICSEKCFTKACALFLPSAEGRAGAHKKLIEKGWLEMHIEITQDELRALQTAIFMMQGDTGEFTPEVKRHAAAMVNSLFQRGIAAFQYEQSNPDTATTAKPVLNTVWPTPNKIQQPPCDRCKQFTHDGINVGSMPCPCACHYPAGTR